MKQNQIFSLLLVIAIGLIIALSTGIAYATNTNTVKLYDNDERGPEKWNFNVAFYGKPTYTGDGTVEVKYINNSNAVIDIKGLKSVGDEVIVTFGIKNKSKDLDAELKKIVKNSNPKYFNVTAELSDDEIDSRGGVETISLKVELIKTPIEKEEKANITVKIIANPEYDD